MCKKLVVALMLLCVTSYASALMPNQVVTHDDTDSIVLSSFEGGMDGWVVQGAGNSATLGESYGATDGFYSLKLSTPNSWWNEAMYIQVASIEGGKDAFFGNNTFSVDVSWKASDWNYNTPSGWNAIPTIGLLVNPDIAWDHGQNPLNWWNGGSQTVPVGDWHSDPDNNWAWTYFPHADGTTTLSWNYQNITSGDINSACTAIKLILQVVYSQYVEPTAFYLDNVQLTGGGYVENTPEPTTIALLGLGSLALLRRRK